jgi:hypothetical protein
VTGVTSRRVPDQCDCQRRALSGIRFGELMSAKAGWQLPPEHRDEQEAAQHNDSDPPSRSPSRGLMPDGRCGQQHQRETAEIGPPHNRQCAFHIAAVAGGVVSERRAATASSTRSLRSARSFCWRSRARPFRWFRFVPRYGCRWPAADSPNRCAALPIAAAAS